MDNTEWLKMVAEVAARAAEGDVIEHSVTGGIYWSIKPEATGFLVGVLYRNKPRTISVNAFEVPEPMRSAPKRDTLYFAAAINAPDLYKPAYWNDEYWDMLWLSRGLCHSTKEAAIAHAKAMLGIDPNQTEE